MPKARPEPPRSAAVALQDLRSTHHFQRQRLLYHYEARACGFVKRMHEEHAIALAELVERQAAEIAALPTTGKGRRS